MNFSDFCRIFFEDALVEFYCFWTIFADFPTKIHHIQDLLHKDRQAPPFYIAQSRQPRWKWYLKRYFLVIFKKKWTKLCKMAWMKLRILSYSNLVFLGIEILQAGSRNYIFFSIIHLIQLKPQKFRALLHDFIVANNLICCWNTKSRSIWNKSREHNNQFDNVVHVTTISPNYLIGNRDYRGISNANHEIFNIYHYICSLVTFESLQFYFNRNAKGHQLNTFICLICK